MKEENIELNEKVDKIVEDIYNYIKYVDKKTDKNDETLKFVTSLQTEQMKELIQAKTNDLRNFFEEAIRLQTEVVRNTYEGLITELKNSFEEDLKNKDIENLKVYNQKIETLKSAYENQITNLRESMENDCQKKLNESYFNSQKELNAQAAKFNQDFNTQAEKFRQEIEDRMNEIKNWHEKNLQDKLDENKKFYDAEMIRRCEEAYKNGKTDTEAWHNEILKKELDLQAEKLHQEFEDRMNEIKSWHEKNLQERLEETKKFYDAEMTRRCEESYKNGKTDTEAWHDEIVKKELDVQGEKFRQEIEDRMNEIKNWHEKNLQDKLDENKKFYDAEMIRRCEEAYKNGKTDTEIWHQNIMKKNLELQAEFYEGEIERAKKETKAEMYAEMDEAARRNEEELKLFLDYYDTKMKPFKRLINIHETTDRRIKDIQRRIKNKINKTIGNYDAVIPPDTTYDTYKVKEKEFEPPKSDN